MSKDAFVNMMTSELPEAPAYFPKDAEINRTGAGALNKLPRPAALTPEEVLHLTLQPQTNSLRYVVLDVRSASEFGAGHVPGSINIGLGGQFAIWAGVLIAIGTPIILVAESETKMKEAVMRLARVGIESVKGYLAGGIDAWRSAGFETKTVSQISVDELDSLIREERQLQIVDVRRPPEYASGHVPRALHAPLSNLETNAGGLPLDPSQPTAVICAGGYRSSAATSILQSRGFSSLLNVTGGTSAWINAGYPVEIPEKQ
jgi:rhodanese-related sulfurtransferase